MLSFLNKSVQTVLAAILTIYLLGAMTGLGAGYIVLDMATLSVEMEREELETRQLAIQVEQQEKHAAIHIAAAEERARLETQALAQRYQQQAEDEKRWTQLYIDMVYIIGSLMGVGLAIGLVRLLFGLTGWLLNRERHWPPLG